MAPLRLSPRTSLHGFSVNGSQETLAFRSPCRWFAPFSSPLLDFPSVSKLGRAGGLNQGEGIYE
eukprot:scaffold14569_cov49-Cyclotella_meneghiniana.AAC.3